VSSQHRIVIDGSQCIGSGECEFRAPNVFRVGDDNLGHVIDEHAGADAHVMAAVRECPAAAITVVPAD
jgi:ferredoxin